MITDNEIYAESLPAQSQEEPQRKFRIEKAQDKDTQTILRARREVHEDPDLSFGARTLFAYLLDLSLNPSVNNFRRGEICVSMRQLGERLHAGKSSLCGWVKDLSVKRHIWVSKLRRPNMDAQNVYHVTALQPRRELALEMAGDPLWGNGKRRPVQEGIRGRPFKKKTLLVDRFGHPLFSQPVENETSQVQNLNRGSADSGPPSARNKNGEAQNLALPVPETGPARRENNTSPFQNLDLPGPKAELLRETPDVSQRALESSLNVQRGAHAFKRGGEDGFLLDAAEVLAGYDNAWAKLEMTNSGAWWRMKFRHDPDKAARMLAEINRMIKERVPFTENPGAAAVDIWKRFA